MTTTTSGPSTDDDRTTGMTTTPTQRPPTAQPNETAQRRHGATRRAIAVGVLAVIAVIAGFAAGRITAPDTASAPVAATPAGGDEMVRLFRTVDAGAPISDAVAVDVAAQVRNQYARTPLPAGHIVSEADVTSSNDLGAAPGRLVVSVPALSVPAGLNYTASVRVLDRDQPDTPAVHGRVAGIHITESSSTVTIVPVGTVDDGAVSAVATAAHVVIIGEAN